MAKNVIIKEHKNELSEEQLKYINELKTLYIDKYKDIKHEEKKVKDFEDLVKKLENIHIKLSYDVLVPVSQYSSKDQPLCFISGKLTNTNEVFMPIGEKYYAKLSTTEGVQHCHRKIDEIKEQILEYEFDKKKFLERITYLEESRIQPGQVEIIEEYDADTPIPGSRRQARRKPKEAQSSTS